MSNEIKSLGFANGWYPDEPIERTECRELKHKLTQKNIGNCLNEYTCPICKYSYKVDSGD